VSKKKTQEMGQGIMEEKKSIRPDHVRDILGHFGLSWGEL
jgi:hypothetical protein